jgi:hypothetical protein
MIERERGAIGCGMVLVVVVVAVIITVYPIYNTIIVPLLHGLPW